MSDRFLFKRMIELLEEIRDRLPEPPVDETLRSWCLFCETVFKVGPGSGRRSDAVFCCDQHRIRYNSAKRTPKLDLSTDNRQ